MFLNNIFYTIKPLIPRRLQIFLRRQVVRYKLKKYRHIWPIDPKAGKPPEDWQGWPGNKRFAIVLSHDVDTQEGHDKCYKLMEIEESLGFRSSFNIVPEKYRVSRKLIFDFKNRGFEVCVHGLNHDGKLFLSKDIFNQRAKRINHYLQEWCSKGFTSPSMHHNLNWMHVLNIIHGTSTFDTDPFEPQPDGVGTIFPFWVKNHYSKRGYVELPYTLPQDFTLFVLLKEKNIDIWKSKLDWIVEKNGMALFNSHPDYMNFEKKINDIEEYPINYYKEFLKYIKSQYKGQYWNGTPNEIATFYKKMIIKKHKRI